MGKLVTFLGNPNEIHVHKSIFFQRMSGGDNCEAVNVSMSPSQLVDSVQLSVVDLQAAQEMGEGDVRQIIVQGSRGSDI